jgi:hypothetical protein
MVTNEQVFIMVSIPVLWNPLLRFLGITTLIERQSVAREKRFSDERNRRRAELPRKQDFLSGTGSKAGVE